MSAKLTTAVTLLVSDAVLAWDSLTLAQRSSLRRCHTVLQLLLSGGQRAEVPMLRLRSDTHARTKDALRSMGVIGSDDLALSDLGALIRSAGMQAEAQRGRKRSGR